MAKKAEFELISRQESVSQALLISPTSFSLAPSSDHAARTKLLLFYNQYLGDTEPVIEWRGGREYLEAQSQNYAYRVTRDLRGASGVDYQIECLRKQPAAGSESPGQNNYANLNAKNLSRFLREGQLELLALRK